jgi:hypothetical protein
MWTHSVILYPHSPSSCKGNTRNKFVVYFLENSGTNALLNIPYHNVVQVIFFLLQTIRLRKHLLKLLSNYLCVLCCDKAELLVLLKPSRVYFCFILWRNFRRNRDCHLAQGQLKYCIRLICYSGEVFLLFGDRIKTSCKILHVRLH